MHQCPAPPLRSWRETECPPAELTSVADRDVLHVQDPESAGRLAAERRSRRRRLLAVVVAAALVVGGVLVASLLTGPLTRRYVNRELSGLRTRTEQLANPSPS